VFGGQPLTSDSIQTTDHTACSLFCVLTALFQPSVK